VLLGRVARWFTTGNVPVKVGVVLSLFGVGFLVKEGMDRQWFTLPIELRLLFVALLSVNLGVLNLLPIPVLDGGHLMFLAAEVVRGRPVSIRVREVAQQAGLFVLLALMAFAFYNDIMRFFTPQG